jgi:tRNA threonylcarbamoyladenosine biosynthesis protein TsaE
MEKVLTSLPDLILEAESFINELLPNNSSATLITLSGELGAGKTTFTKAVAKSLGIDEIVNSPTFVLEKIYDIPQSRTQTGTHFSRLIHIDAYRLDTGAQLSPIHFDELMTNPRNLIFLEWPEKVFDALPAAHTHISLAVLPDGSRTISYEKQ